MAEEKKVWLRFVEAYAFTDSSMPDLSGVSNMAELEKVRMNVETFRAKAGDIVCVDEATAKRCLDARVLSEEKGKRKIKVTNAETGKVVTKEVDGVWQVEVCPCVKSSEKEYKKKLADEKAAHPFDVRMREDKVFRDHVLESAKTDPFLRTTLEREGYLGEDAKGEKAAAAAEG